MEQKDIELNSEMDNTEKKKNYTISSSRRDRNLVESIENEIESTGGDTKKEIDYEATIELPSKGRLYDSNLDKVTIRGMTTREEKILFASNGDDVLKRIFKNCIISPEDVDINELMDADVIFLTIQLRMLTYGDEYHIQARCPKCGKTDNYTVHLSDLEISYISDEFTEPFYITTRTGDKLGLRLLRKKDTEFVEKYSRKFARDMNLNYLEVLYVCKMAKHIVSINDNPIDFIDAKDYVDNMFGYDSAKLRTAVEKWSNFGVETGCSVTCTSCGNKFSFALPVNDEFFRPHIE